MKRLLFVIACLSLAVSVLADPVTASQARQKASQFLNKRVAKRARAKAPAANALKLMAAGKGDSYYIFNVGDDGGYVVVSGEDATEEILGYSDTGSIDPDNMPCGMRMLLENYREQIKEIRTKKYKKTQRTSPKNNYIGEFHISENLRSLFGQGSTDNLDRPFNLLCPSYDGNDNHHCVTGCVATAMAGLMYAFKWPSAITSEIPAYVSETLRLNIPAIAANTTINWSNIKQEYINNYSDQQGEEVAKLMKMAGASVRMDYNRSSNTSVKCVPYALSKYFGYETAICEESYYYPTTEWLEKLRSELRRNVPVLYRGNKSKIVNGVEQSPGHAFLLEGYDEDGFFDVNFGWEGVNNDKYKLTVDPDGKFIDYLYNQAALFGVTPRSSLSPVDVSFRLWTDYLGLRSNGIYNRSSETGNFEDINLEMNLYNFMPIQSITSQIEGMLYDYGVEVKNENEPQNTERIRMGTYDFPFITQVFNDENDVFSFGKDYSDGKYEIRLISREFGHDAWVVNDNSQHENVEAWIFGDKCVLKSKVTDAPSLILQDLSQNSSNTLRTGQSEEFTYVIKNPHSIDYYEGYILVSIEWREGGAVKERSVSVSDVVQVSAGNHYINSFTFTPFVSGNQDIVLYNSSWEEIGRRTINVIPANASLDMLEVTNLTIDGDLDHGLIDGTILRGTISLKNHDTVTKKSSITICLFDTETQQTKYKPIFVHIEPNNTVTYDFSFSNLIDGHHYEVYGTYASGEEFYRSPQLLCTTAGMGETEPGNEDLVAYEYWFDDDVDGRTSVNLGSNDAVIRASIDTHGLSIGLHRFNFRLKRSDNKYSSVTTSLFMNLRTASEGRIVYWFDDNSEQTCSTPLADIEEEQQVALDLSNSDKFPVGFHTLNMRVATDGKSLSNIYKTRVLKTATGDFDRIEYWVDGNFPSQASQRGYVTASSSSGKEFNFENKTFNLSNVPSGPHRIYYRAVSSKGITGSAVGMASVFVGGGTPSMIEYWFDGDATKSATVPLPASALQDTVDVALVMSDIEKFPLGFHLLSMRLVSEGREQSPVYSARVLKMASGEANQMEYWVDGDYDNRKTVTGKTASSDANSFIFTDPFDLSDVSAGLHCVYYRATSTNGITKSAIYMTPVFVGGGNTTKLEYWFDDENGSGGVQTLSGSADPTDDKVVYFNQTINLDNLSSGVHRLFYRGVNNEGVSKTAVSMTPILVKSMFGGGEAVLSSFSIVVDNVEVDHGALNGENEQLFTYKLDATELSLGNHTLKASFMNSYGVRITEQIPFRVIERPPFIKGDVNNDMKVTITDAVAIVNYILGSPSTNFNEDAADVNEDGYININDAVSIVNMILTQRQ